MILKDIVPYCLNAKNGVFENKYYWIINGLTYTIDSLETLGSDCTDGLFNYELHFDSVNYIYLSRYNFVNSNETQRQYDTKDNYLFLSLDNEITIFDKFIMVHKIRPETTEDEANIFCKQNYFITNNHSASIQNYTIGLFHTDPVLGGMATNLRTVFKDLIFPPVQPKPAELTLDEKVDDLISSLIPEDKINEPIAWVVTSENGVERPTCITEQQAVAVANSLKYHRESLKVVPLYEHPPKMKDSRSMAIKKLKRMLNERL